VTQLSLLLLLLISGGLIYQCCMSNSVACRRPTHGSTAELLLPICARTQKQRGKERHEFFKRTSRGQPVMKVRVDKILAALQRDKGVA
jgi:rRNA processing